LEQLLALFTILPPHAAISRNRRQQKWQQLQHMEALRTAKFLWEIACCKIYISSNFDNSKRYRVGELNQEKLDNSGKIARNNEKLTNFIKLKS
jgi:hypothetical protein